MKHISLCLALGALAVLAPCASAVTCPTGLTLMVTEVQRDATGVATAVVFGYEFNPVDGKTELIINSGSPCNFMLPTNFRIGMISRPRKHTGNHAALLRHPESFVNAEFFDPRHPRHPIKNHAQR